jgi:ABC-type Fe3+ transport system permease subunit
MRNARGLPITVRGRGTERMQQALGAASIVVAILLFLLLVGLLYDLIMGYSARRRFATPRATPRNPRLKGRGRSIACWHSPRS